MLAFSVCFESTQLALQLHQVLTQMEVQVFFLNHVWFAATQLARQVQQERTQVVCSNKVARKRLARRKFMSHVCIYRGMCVLLTRTRF